MTPGRSDTRAGSDSFGRVLHAEWTKFRTVRGWIIGLIVGVLVMVGLGLFVGGNVSIGCGTPNGPQLSGKACLPYIPIGPGGEPVTDSFSFVHQPLAGNGSITTQVTSLTGQYQVGHGNGPVAAPGQGIPVSMASGTEPWAKAGIMVKASTHQGSAYAAMMVTGSHGVRMQYNYTGDIAGLPGKASASAPRWLRLTRSGDVLTGYDSADGSHWTRVGTVTLTGLPSTIAAGLFTTSPEHVTVDPFSRRGNSVLTPSQATGGFGHVGLADGWTSGRWAGTAIGAGNNADYQVQSPGSARSYTQTGGRFSVTGSGDIAPVVAGRGSGFPTYNINQLLVGVLGGLIAMIVVATMFMTAEYRRGLIRSTFAAAPRRGRVLAAKAIVAGLVTFVAGLIATLIAVPVGARLAADKGEIVLPVSWLTEVQVVAGTAALLAVAAVLAVALGAIMRRSAAVVTTVIVAIMLPYFLCLTVLPEAAADWVLRLTPAAAFAIQQSVTAYAQVNATYSPTNGYFPLAPLAGFAVLCAYAAAALVLASFLLNRRDA
jgi:ABC-type transport system involved in multi-copper enzyme maturation permease subunit